MRKRRMGLILAISIILAFNSSAEDYGGIDFPNGDISFADGIVSFKNAEGVEGSYANPSSALGPPDYDSEEDTGYVSLGNGKNVCEGELILEFIDNALVDIQGDDLWIFEIGSAVEAIDVYVSDDGKNWISLGVIEGSTRGVDIAEYISPGQKFQFVKLCDHPDGRTSGSPWGGPDIDAVGAIGTITITSATSLTAEPVLIFEVNTLARVENDPPNPTKFTLDRSYLITEIRTYHWNYGQGQIPGTIGIQDEEGNNLEAMFATGLQGMGGVPNAYWSVLPNWELSPGEYNIIDSDPLTWSHNWETSGQGIAWVYGLEVSEKSRTPGQSLPQSSIRPVDYAMTSEVSEEGFDAIARTNSFSTTDDRVICWLKFENLKEGHTIEWRWYSPDGNLYHTYKKEIPFPKNMWTWYNIYSHINIKGYPLEEMSGSWEVDAFIDGEFIVTQQFTIGGKATIGWH